MALSAKAVSRSAFVALRRVVEHDVEDDFDAGAVQRVNHRLQVVDGALRIAAVGVTAHRSEQRERVVTPIIPQRFSRVGIQHARSARGERLDGHELERRHSQRPEIGDLLDDAQILSGVTRAGGGMDGETAHVGLVDHGLAPRAAERFVALPVESSARNRAHRTSVDLAGLPLLRAGDCTRIRIEQNRRRIVTVSLPRLRGAIRAQRIQMTGLPAMYARVPDVAGAVPARIEIDARCAFARSAVKHERHAFGMAAENGEIDPAAAIVRSERQRRAGAHRPGPARGLVRVCGGLAVTAAVVPWRCGVRDGVHVSTAVGCCCRTRRRAAAAPPAANTAAVNQNGPLAMTPKSTPADKEPTACPALETAV